MQQDAHFDYLQHEELIPSTREWKKRTNACSGQIFMLNLALTRTTTTNQYLQHKLKTTLIEGSLPKIAKLFRKAVDSGAFKKRSTLYNLLFDTTSNYYLFINEVEMVMEKGTIQAL